MHHAYQRVRKENSEVLRRWKEAMQELSKGDHYILVLCQDGSRARPTSVFLKFPVLASLVISLLLLVPFMFLAFHYDSPSGRARGRYVAPSGVRTPMPLWLQRLLLVLMIGAYVYGILPWIWKRPSPRPVSVFSKLFRRESRSTRR